MQTVLIQIRFNVVSVLILVQTVYSGYQETTVTEKRLLCVYCYCCCCSCCFFFTIESPRQQEFVLIRDKNSDHDRRHLDGGLPSSLKFEIIREAGDVKLTLEENNRLNPNAPVYDIKEDHDGSMSLVRKDVPPIMVRTSLNNRHTSRLMTQKPLNAYFSEPHFINVYTACLDKIDLQSTKNNILWPLHIRVTR